jgi:putative component of toxin-antitoxin plasmid stabilization module
MNKLANGDFEALDIKSIQGLKKVREARGSNGGRVYFRRKENIVEVLSHSNKTNQKKVILYLKKIY